MKRSVGFLGIIVLAMLAVGSLALAQQAGHMSVASGTSENNYANTFASKECCKADCCKEDCCTKECCKGDCGKADCCKEDCCKSSCNSDKNCSMKSDSTKQCSKAMMHGTGKSEKECCKGMKKEKCGESTMGKKSEHHPAKTKTPKTPEPKKADK